MAGQADPLHDAVIRAYTTPGDPVAFSAPERVAERFGISKSRARRILEHVDGYRIHREYKKPATYNPYYVHAKREQVQADLIDMANPALLRKNDGVRFLLVLIDIFTKKVWVYPLKNKSAQEMVSALQTWLDSLQTAPEKLKTDSGTEFTNRQVQNLLRQRGVRWLRAYGTMKAAVAERVNKTLQILIYKYITQSESHRYIDHLQDFVDTYNARRHRTIKMSPDEAERAESQAELAAMYHEKYESMRRENASKRANAKLKLGDVVRIKTEAKKISSSSRAYAEQFHGEYFIIDSINYTMAVPMYHLRSYDTGDKIDGGFYSNELQIQRGNVYKIERVLAERRRRGRDEVLVKWMYFGDRWNEWVPKADVVTTYVAADGDGGNGARG